MAWPFIFIFIFVLTFFSKLILPEPSLFVTPDFGRSDALHSNIPLKLELAKSLKRALLPTWSNQIAQGYPILAEGIIGSFYIPNLIIFSLASPNWTIPLMYIATFLICAVSMYVLLIELRIARLAALIGTLSYTFCASMMLHVQHFNFIQAASLLPLIMFFLLKLLKKPSLKNSLILIILYSQLFFVGFVQIYIYSVIIFFCFLVMSQYKSKGNFFKIPVIFLIIIAASLFISLAQLLPSLELNGKSLRSEGLGTSYILGNFPMSPGDLVTFLNPFIRGVAKNGTANSIEWTKEGIYWESTSYIGILPFVLFLTTFFFYLKKSAKDKKIYLIIALLAFITTLISLGKYSPTHILFSFPPFNLFRVPSRFILFTQFFLAILSAYGAKKILELIPTKLKKSVSILFVFLITIDIFTVWWNYNPIGTYEKWIREPETAQAIKKIDTSSRIISLGGLEAWNSTFLKNGWDNRIENYYFYRNSLDPNINLLFGLTQSSMFETLPTKRYGLYNSVLFSDIIFNEKEITLGEKAKVLLDNNNTRFIVSTKEIKNSNYRQLFETEKDNIKYRIYESNKKTGFGKVYYNYKSISTPDEYPSIYQNTDMETTVILEKKISSEITETGKYNIKSEKITNSSFEYEVETNKPGLFVLSNSFFPGWLGKIDGKDTEIFAANINNQAISIPQGTHKVSFTYRPKQLRIGLIITIVSYLIILLLLIRIKKGHD